ncbi:MAG: Fe-S cluster assembly protein SufD [Hyphomicrobium sp.]|nr:Fe-S cluster assembly protein SufD [Hyphomicrobium sp.]
MTVQVIKTKAEQALAARIGSLLASSALSPAEKRVREAASSEFQTRGLPSRRIEEWKFSDLRNLLKEAGNDQGSTPREALEIAQRLGFEGVDADTYILIDGRMVGRPEGQGEPGVRVERLADSVRHDPAVLGLSDVSTLDDGQKSVLALNTAMVTDGAVVTIAPGTPTTRPIHIVHVGLGAVAVRNIINVGAGSRATVVETHVGGGEGQRFENAVTTVNLADGATLEHLFLIETDQGSAYLGNIIAALGASAVYRPFQLTSGAGLLRQQGTITFDGQHGSFDFSAASVTAGEGHQDTTLVVDHKVPHCTSRELYKTVLDGTARGVFQGKVIVRPDAQKTDGKQMAQALMLSGEAEFDSKPELEIYADDVICGHGSTSAEIDPDLIFYCRSRGIPEAQARALLIESFIGEAVERIDHDGLRVGVMARAMGLLRRSDT